MRDPAVSEKSESWMFRIHSPVLARGTEGTATDEGEDTDAGPGAETASESVMVAEAGPWNPSPLRIGEAELGVVELSDAGCECGGEGIAGGGAFLSTFSK